MTTKKKSPPGKIKNEGRLLASTKRWVVKNDSLPSYLVVNCSFEFSANKVILDLCQIADLEQETMPSIDWADKIKNDPKSESMQFVALTSFGDPMYTLNIGGLSLVKHTSVFHCGKASMATDRLELQYETFERVVHKDTITTWALQVLPNRHECFVGLDFLEDADTATSETQNLS